jgi:type I restriction enzyme S subunit
LTKANLDWIKCTLDELGVFSKGSGVTKAEVRESGFPCIRYGEIYTHHRTVVSAYNSFIDDATARTSKRIEYGDILLAGSGETKEEIGKATAFMFKDEAYAGGDIVIFRPRNSDSTFLAYLLNSQAVISQKASAGKGDAVVHISATDLGKIQINIPALGEQKAIAKALSDVDELIEGLKLEIAKKQNVKESVCRPLVLGTTRLKGFTNSWSQRTLGDELGYEQPTKYLVDTTEHKETGNIPVLTAGKSFILGYSDDTEGIYTNTPTILFDDFTTDSKFVDFDFKVKSSACKMLKNINSKANLRFFHTLMQYLEFRPYDHKRYWISEYSKLEILVPEPIEQNAIADIVEDFENQIKFLKFELAKYECIKQGMAHDLLTGKVRLV